MDYEDSLNIKLKLDEVIKIRVKKDRKLPVEQEDIIGSNDIAEFTDPEILHEDKDTEDLYRSHPDEDISRIFTDNPEENAKKLHQVEWGDFNIDRIVNALVLIGEKITGMTSMPYQIVFERRVYRAILTNSSYTITYRVARQSGKSTTTAKIIVTLCTLMPALAKVFPKQLGIYSKGFWVGVFAPVGDQATTLYDRVKDMAHSQEAQVVYEDPDIDVEINKKGGCKWDNGSKVYVRSASTKAKIESLSLHMAMVDEAQEVDRGVVNKSIRPMLAWNNGLMLMAGTSSRDPGILYEQVQKNMQMDMVLPKKEQLHYQYIDDDVMKYNPRYKLHCETQKAEIGEYSPEYLMSYKLKWIFENDRPFNEELIKMYIMRVDRDIVRSTARPVVIGIDLASKRMSSVVTAIEILNVTNIYDDKEESKAVGTAAVCDWLEIKDTPYPQQRPAMKAFIDKYENVVGIYVDTTGAGDPVFAQMLEEWEDYSSILKPHIFSGKAKADLAKILDDYFFSNRLIIPSNKEARKTKKWQSFFLQLLNLVAVVKDGYSYYARNEKINTSRDDYVDSLMLALFGVNDILTKAAMIGEGEETYNPYFSKTTAPKTSDSRNRSFPGIDGIREAVRNGTYVAPNMRGMTATRRTPKIYRK